VRSEEDLATKLLSQQYIEEWFLQGFNLNFIFLGKDQQDLDTIALKILNKCKFASKSMHLSMQCVRFTPRSSDNFRSEDILDTISNNTAVTNITDAKALELTEAIDYLENNCSSNKHKTSRNTLLQGNSSKLSNIET